MRSGCLNLKGYRKSKRELLSKSRRGKAKSFQSRLNRTLRTWRCKWQRRFVMSDTGLRLLGVLGVPLALAAIGAMTALIRGSLQSQVSFAEGRMFAEPTMIGGAIVGDGRKAGAPVNMEVLLNAAQLAEFKTRVAERSEPVVVNLAMEFNATNLVEKFEEQKVIYAKRRI